MPVILKNEDYALWLDPIAKREILQPLLIPYPSEEMNSYPVSPKVNKATYDSPDSIEPMFLEGSESQSLRLNEASLLDCRLLQPLHSLVV